MCSTSRDKDEAFIEQVLGASLALMSILIAVIGILAVEHKAAKPDPPLAASLEYMVIGTTLAVIFAGLIGFFSLLYLRGYWKHVQFIYWAFAFLIFAVMVGVPVVVWQLLGL